MVKVKPEWDKIKREYILGEIENVREFLRVRYGDLAASPRTIDNRTKGWSEERLRIKKVTLEIAIGKHIEDVTPPNERLLKTKYKILDTATQILDERGQMIDMNDLKTLWIMIKTELGEPTTIAKSENNNNNQNVTLQDFLSHLKDVDTQTHSTSLSTEE